MKSPVPIGLRRHFLSSLATCLVLAPIAGAQVPSVAPGPIANPVSQPASVTAQPAPFQPNILDGLEGIELTNDPSSLEPGASPMLSRLSPYREALRPSPTYKVSSFIDQAAPALGGPDLSLPIPNEAPQAPIPANIDSAAAPEIGTPLEQPMFPPQSLGWQSFGNVSAPKFLSARRSIPIGGGRVRYSAEVVGGVAYNNNVFGTASDTKGDVVMSLQPTVYVEAGKKGSIRFLWAPSVYKYAKYKQFDSVNQTFLFSSRYRITKLTLGLDASYVTQSGLFLNSQGQSKQSTLLARIFASYPLTRKTDMFFAAEASQTSAEPGGNQFQGSLSASVDYRYSRKTTVGGGINLGYYNSPNGSMTYQSFLLRLLYNPTSKLTFSADGGLQFRQSTSSTSGSSTSSTAILSAVLGYRVSSKTSLSLRFFRNVEVDAFNSANLMTVTGLEGTLGWQMTKRAFLNATLLGGNVEQSTLGGAADGSYSFVQGTVSISYVLLQDVNVRVFNSFQQRSRGAEGTNFSSNTSGMSLGARF